MGIRSFVALALFAALLPLGARAEPVCEAIEDLLMTGVLLLDATREDVPRDPRQAAHIRAQLDWVGVVAGRLRTAEPGRSSALEQLRRRGEALHDAMATGEGRVSRQAVEVFHGQVRRLHGREGCDRLQRPFASADAGGRAHASGELPASVAAAGPGGSGGGGGDGTRRSPQRWYAEAENKQDIRLWSVFTLAALVVVPPLFRIERRRARRAVRYLFTAKAGLVLADGTLAEARFIDISCRGARFILDQPMTAGARFEILVEDMQIPARAVWVHGLLAGAVFETVQPEDGIEGLRRTQDAIYGIRAA